jgi:hypothetical protein
MTQVTIRKPVWKDRSISIRKELVEMCLKNLEGLVIKIETNPYKEYTYTIDPAKVVAVGKTWIVKGTELINFPISEMQINA